MLNLMFKRKPLGNTDFRSKPAMSHSKPTTAKMSRSLIGLSLACLMISTDAHAASVRLKELVNVVGVRENSLVGYGLVVGLNGTGDTESVFFTSQSISSMLGRLGIRVDPEDVRVRNVAAVMVTARLPAFARTGSQIDIQVSSIGNARSLAGGVLLLTPLAGPNGDIYALGQGPVQVGGFHLQAAGSSVQKNQTTTGRVPSGGMVEKTVAPELGKGPVMLALKDPDFTTAARVAEAVNTALGEEVASALDPASIEVKFPDSMLGAPVALLSSIETLEVDADQRAKVVVNERTGTVVAGAKVRIRPVAVAHGGIRIAVEDRTRVSQPAPFAQQGTTQLIPGADLIVEEDSRDVVALPATASVQELVSALNTLGVTPRDLIAILQAMKAAGAIDADLEVL